jgi:hypothetical protein
MVGMALEELVKDSQHTYAKSDLTANDICYEEASVIIFFLSVVIKFIILTFFFEVLVIQPWGSHGLDKHSIMMLHTCPPS